MNYVHYSKQVGKLLRQAEANLVKQLNNSYQYVYAVII